MVNKIEEEGKTLSQVRDFIAQEYGHHCREWNDLSVDHKAAFVDLVAEEYASLQCAEMKEELERLRQENERLKSPIDEARRECYHKLKAQKELHSKDIEQLQEEVERLRSALRKAEKVITSAATEAQRTEIHRYLSGGYVEMIEAAAFNDSCGIQQALSGKESKTDK